VTLRITGGDLKRLLDCERRLWIAERGRPRQSTLGGGGGGGRGDHEDMLGEKNRALEERFARALPGVVGPVARAGLTLDQAAEETLRLLREGASALRRPVLLSPDGRLVAMPAFLRREGDALVVTDVRLAHHPDKKRDNRVRIAFAALVTRLATGLEVSRLEIVNGQGRTVTVRPEPDDELLALAERATELMGEGPEPDLLLSHSHCQDCPYYRRCWDRAEAERRAEVVPSVTPARMRHLRELGIRTFDDLSRRDPATFTHRELASAADIMVTEARAFATGAPVWMRDPEVPVGRTPVWFDVESDADGERAEVPVYLWGVAIGDAEHTESVRSELTRAGDREGWERFTALALDVFRRHPDAVWVHWNLAEPMWIDRYTARFGAPAEFTARMTAPGARYDLHKALETSVRLPLRSTSAKFVAPWLGFRWSNPNADAAWSTAQLHRAKRTRDAAERARLLDEVERYNADDLWAMRVVWRFLQGAPRA
jgi:uncharacterized protein